MPRNEDGEYELVVGNKQLLSVVFVLFVMFGIFFSLGYFVGRNTAPETTAAVQLPAASGGVRQPAEPPPPAVANPAYQLAPGEARVAEEGAQPGGESQAQGTTPAAAEPVPAQQMPPSPQPESTKTALAGGGALPQPGEMYLQVAAVKRPEAEVIVDVLKRKGFPALVAPVVINGVPSDALYRALVGPLRDTSHVASTKSELEAAGFKPIVRKY